MEAIPTLKNFATVQCAAAVCLRPDVLHRIMEISPSCLCCDRSVRIDIYRTLFTPVVLGLNIPPPLDQEVLSYTMPIALHVADLIMYHEHTFNITRTEILRWVDMSLFTCYGTVNYLELGKKLIQDKELGLISHYKLSCFYFIQCAVVGRRPCVRNLLSCFLWKNLPKETRELLLDQENFGLPLFISRILYSKCNINMRFSETVLFQIFKLSVISGSIFGVQYSCEKIKFINRTEFLVSASVVLLSLIGTDDGICLQKGYRLKRLLAPKDFYIDILLSFITEMDNNEKEMFAVESVRGNDHIKYLKYLISWPNQRLFMKMAILFRHVITEQNFLCLLREIVSKLDPTCGYPEDVLLGNTCTKDYHCILRWFWEQSAPRHRRYFFRSGDPAKQVLTRIIALSNFTDFDEENFITIVEDATADEKQRLYNDYRLHICYISLFQNRIRLASWFLITCCPDKGTLIVFVQNLFKISVLGVASHTMVQRMELADYLLVKCFDTDEEISFFKSCVPFSVQQVIYFDLISNHWQAFVEFMEWCFDTDEEEKDFLKRRNNDFSRICNRLIVYSFWPEVELFLTWMFETEREIDAYKRHVVFPVFGIYTFSCLVLSARFHEAETYVQWVGLSESEIREVKHRSVLSYDNVTSALTDLLFGNTVTSPRFDEKGRNLEGENLSAEVGPYKECIRRCGGRVQAVALIIRWLLTDEKVTLMYKRQFHKASTDYALEKSVDTTLGLAVFDQIIRQHLQDLTVQE